MGRVSLGPRGGKGQESFMKATDASTKDHPLSTYDLILHVLFDQGVIRDSSPLPSRVICSCSWGWISANFSIIFMVQ